MPPVRLLLVSRPGESRDAYSAALDRLGVHYDIASSFSEIRGVAGQKAYNGLLLDILTLVRAKKDEKNAAYDYINFFPSIRIKWDPRKETISVLFFGLQASNDDADALKNFIDEQCRPFPGRTVRQTARKEILLHLRLSRTPDRKGVKTFSTNLSQGGAFIQTVEEFAEGETVWIRFEELFDRVPVSAKVCWQQEWGGRRVVPGVGIRFDSLTEEQTAELSQFL